MATLSPRAPTCAAEAQPQELPRVDALVDSTMLAMAVHELNRDESPASGYVLISLAFDEEGLNVRQDVLEHSVPRQVADSIRHLVFSTRREVDESEHEWGVRLKVDVAEAVTMEVGRREFCPPVARSIEMHRAMHSYSPTGVRIRRGMRERTLHVRARVSELGTITNSRIVRGELSGSSLERDIGLFLQQFLFNPATVDGEPTGAWVEIPVRVRMPQ